MVIREEYLVTINAKNRVQVARVQLSQNPFTGIYTIIRETGQYGGKLSVQPFIEIEFGKAKRTPSEQASLQYNCIIKNYLDKGYIKLASFSTKHYEDMTEDEIKALFGNNFITDQKGVPKPMLAKLADQCSSSIWDKEWIVSRKIDGVRCLMYFKDGLILTASRGGGNYNAATKHIREDQTLRSIFVQNPDLILDGELYHHGADWPLQRISGVTRQQEWTEECGQLEYWVYDYVSKEPFKQRWVNLRAMSKSFPEDSPVKIIEQRRMTGYLNIKKEHDKYVQEGFEGLCARNPEREYGVNKRSAIYLVKLKERKDDEFEIIGIKEGLRPEDMCFLLKTKNGKEFAAKPVGNIESRKYFLNHKDEFIGKFATCTYFNLSQDGIPQQPVLKSIRPDDE